MTVDYRQIYVTPSDCNEVVSFIIVQNFKWDKTVQIMIKKLSPCLSSSFFTFLYSSMPPSLLSFSHHLTSFYFSSFLLFSPFFPYFLLSPRYISFARYLPSFLLLFPPSFFPYPPLLSILYSFILPSSLCNVTDLPHHLPIRGALVY